MRDSLHIEAPAQPIRHRPPTPREILSQLPSDATPEQQDSAIQAHFQPGETHWSQRPDTLHLPGHLPGKSINDVSLPTYYRESFFSGDSLFHPELPGGRLGVAGDPLPYSVANDDVLTSLLLGCFLFGCVAFSQSRNFIVRQGRNFFSIRRSGMSEWTETTSEILFQVFLVLLTALLFGLIGFFHLRETVGETFIIDQYQVIGLLTGGITTYYALKMLLYTLADAIFFDWASHKDWIKSYLFITSTQGVVLFPPVMLVSYFGTPVSQVSLFALAVIALGKALSFYKCYLIFFRQKALYVQIFLYFCALEIVPLFALWSMMATIGNYLKVNF